MEVSTAPIEGIVVIVVDDEEDAPRIERSLAQAGAAVFVAHDRSAVLAVMTKVTPHFAVIDPASVGGTSPDGVAKALFDHDTCRAFVYSRDLPAVSGVKLRWLIDKREPVSMVVEAILEAMRDPVWVRKGGDDVKPIL